VAEAKKVAKEKADAAAAADLANKTATDKNAELKTNYEKTDAYKAWDVAYKQWLEAGKVIATKTTEANTANKAYTGSVPYADAVANCKKDKKGTAISATGTCINNVGTVALATDFTAACDPTTLKIKLGLA